MFSVYQTGTITCSDIVCASTMSSKRSSAPSLLHILSVFSLSKWDFSMRVVFFPLLLVMHQSHYKKNRVCDCSATHRIANGM